MSEISVTDPARQIVLTLTPQEAVGMIADLDLLKSDHGPTWETQILYGALCAIRDHRPYGAGK